MKANPKLVSYPENVKLKSVASSASLPIYNVQTKGILHTSMAKLAVKEKGYTSRSIHSIASY